MNKVNQERSFDESFKAFWPTTFQPFPALKFIFIVLLSIRPRRVHFWELVKYLRMIYFGRLSEKLVQSFV